MMQWQQVQKSLITGRMVVPVTILLTVLLRLYTGFGSFTVISVIILLAHIGIALLLLQMNHVFTIIRNRTLLPALFYLLLVSSHTELFSDLVVCGITLIFLLCFFCSFYSYQQKKSQVYLFNIALLLTTGTLFWKPAPLFLPLFWFAFLQFKSLNRKSITASILGVFVVCLFVFVWAVLKMDIRTFTGLLPSVDGMFSFTWEMPDWGSIVRFIFTGLLVICSFVFLMTTLYSEKIRSLSFLYFFYTFLVIAGIFYFFSPQNQHVIASVMYIPVAFVISRFFTLTKSKYAVYTLVFSILFYIVLFFEAGYPEFFDDFPWIDLK